MQLFHAKISIRFSLEYSKRMKYCSNFHYLVRLELRAHIQLPDNFKNTQRI